MTSWEKLKAQAIRAAKRKPAGKRAGSTVQEWIRKSRSRKRQDNPPPWALDADKWDRARQAVERRGWDDAFADPWAMVAYIYKRMGGRIARG